jgi:hypothetical protein
MNIVAAIGSILVLPFVNYYGDCSSVGRAPDCDSGGRGFEPHQSPQFILDLIEGAGVTPGADLLYGLFR